MKIRYLKSASVTVETHGVKILADPWLVDGEYYGSWCHYPEFEFRDEFFADVDYIYISHIHPDHFSRKTLERLRKDIPVLIHSYESKFLKQNIERLGFAVTELPHGERVHLKDGVHISIYAADNCNPQLCAQFFGCGLVETKFGSTQIDSMSVIDDGKFSVLNLNDCPFQLAQESLGKVRRDFPSIDFLFVGYGGAGPYPQCFVMSDEELTRAVASKRKSFLLQAERYIAAVAPRYYMPFAGTYSLAGKFAHLQALRGVPEIEEALAWCSASSVVDQSRSSGVLLNPYEYFDLETESYSRPYEPQDLADKQRYIETVLATRRMDYEDEPLPSEQMIAELIPAAFSRMEAKRREIGFSSDTTVFIEVAPDRFAQISMKGEGFKFVDGSARASADRFVSYSTDPRLLLRILQGPRFAHWNNAEIGSHIRFERRPDTFERGLYHAMCFFHS